MDDGSKIACFRCIARKERIDEIERYFLMWEHSLKMLVKHITELKMMKDEIDIKLEDFKADFDRDYLSCS